MTTEHNEQQSVVKQNLTTQPAAAQEVVAWRDDAGNLYPDKESVDKYLPRGRTAHALYAAPVIAAPATYFPLTLRGLIAYGQVAADPSQRAVPNHMRYLIEQMVPHLKRLDEIESNTPAAPGIDNTTPVDRGALQMAINVLRRAGKDEVADALIDASPKGGSEAWKPIETAPKDARWLMLGIAGRNEIMLGYWSRLHQGWWGQTCANGEFKIWQRATHWMPMPNAPMQAGDAEVQP